MPVSAYDSTYFMPPNPTDGAADLGAAAACGAAPAVALAPLAII
jgi:hypothetical protein